MDKWISLIDIVKNGKDDLLTIIKQAKSKILNLAIRGKLVPQDPNDEPAIELLKRINPDFTPCDNEHSRKLPQNWCICRLKDLCSFLSRGKSPKYSENDKTYPVFAQKCNFKDGGISLEQARFLDPSTICKWSETYKLRTGDILVNSKGGTTFEPDKPDTFINAIEDVLQNNEIYQKNALAYYLSLIHISEPTRP